MLSEANSDRFGSSMSVRVKGSLVCYYGTVDLQHANQFQGDNLRKRRTWEPYEGTLMPFRILIDACFIGFSLGVTKTMA